MRRLLLISNSTLYGSGYLDHCADAIVDFLGEDVERVLFVPYALHDRDAYAATVRARFEAMGLGLDSIHDAPGGPQNAVEQAQALFIGGGNTFRLLSELYANELLEPIRERVASGMPYMGSSAGTVVACVSMQTTNDMPIVQPPSFAALALVPFNINPHFLDADPDSKHMGETREQRLAEFHEMNAGPVLALREGAMLRVEGSDATLLGAFGGKLFLRGEEPQELAIGTDLGHLLA